MPLLLQPPRLVTPTTAVRASYLEGERVDCLAKGAGVDWYDAAAADFDGYVADRAAVRELWDVPVSTYWYVSGEHYVGTLVIRHRLTPDLAQAGGHIGYHVLGVWQRQGHATRMLAEALPIARGLGIDRALLTCDADNVPSRRTILTNGGVPDGQALGEDRFWIDLR